MRQLDAFTGQNWLITPAALAFNEAPPQDIYDQKWRRDFISVIGGAAATWPLAVRAKQPAMPVIGFVRITTPQDSAPFLSAFKRGLAESSYIEGQMLQSKRASRSTKSINYQV
jgi:hypothetical protein